MKFVHRARGISLVEVVVTLALITIAAGGLIRVCMHARSTASRATTHQMAWRLAAEMAEWLRVRGDLPLGKLPEDPAALIAARDTSSNCYDIPCSASDAARFFLRDWYRRLHSHLPGAGLMICYGTPMRAPAAGKNARSCGNEVQHDGVVWFRLGYPEQNAGRDFFSSIELNVRRGE